MVAGRGRCGRRRRGRGCDSREGVDTAIRVHVIVFTMVGTIIHQISVGTCLVNLSELKLLTLHLLQLLLLGFRVEQIVPHRLDMGMVLGI